MCFLIIRLHKKDDNEFKSKFEMRTFIHSKGDAEIWVFN